ncbi:CRISPR-associated protein Cas1 [Chitinophaga dinghuensis]|uniref:CRISPR-associated endonuclease Cas1 n=1 Tax=Chitinophaga dinghuensis TaxID=1539050 RepID=A0A327WBX1_9BACT|nr:type II CRISPR-associated endonuclease Cas1 [Chitinophaga dinghuensis]RAJ88257.1 CRISPR-associated protein Cas1 [Chitinophaga dinghuensis]
MIKRTLYFGNPAYLKTRDNQLVIELPGTGEVKQAVIEDIGILILDNRQITVTLSVLAKLLANNVAVITCNDVHHPVGMMLNLDGNTLQNQRYQYQVNASAPLKKQLWQQTIAAKITNQANLFEQKRLVNKSLLNLATSVKSGDSDNNEARAAIYYWRNLFPNNLNFKRSREGDPPNNLLNYGYSILRAVVARSLVGSGLLPTLGIFHRNQYNAYCLADDIMEPYRPYVDMIVEDIVRMNGKYLDMTPSMKEQLLNIPAMDVILDDERSPLMNAVQRTTASLAKCFEGTSRKLLYPVMHTSYIKHEL